MDKILTISIAAYNVERYIQKALDSLIDKDIIDDLEVFVVDDGGTDKTMMIAKEYAKQYPNSIFCVHKDNGGYGSTINTSIKLATGKYFKQLDGDDWFKKENLKNFINILKNTSADVVLTNSQKYYEINNSYSVGLEYNHLKEGEYLLEDSHLDTRLSMHTVAFKTTFLKAHEKPLTEHSMYTDTEYVSYPLIYINTVYILHEVIYVYRIGREEQSFSLKSVQKHYKDMERVFNTCLSIYKEIDSSCKVKQRIMFEILCERTKNLFRFYLALPISLGVLKKIKRYVQFLESSCPEVLKKVRYENRTLKILLSTHFLTYPLACLWTRHRWNNPAS